MSDVRTAALLLALVAVGALLVAAAGIPRARAWLPTLVALSPFTGMIAFAALGSLLAATGVPARAPLVIAALAALGLGGLALRRRSGSAPSGWERRDVPTARWERPAEVVALLALVPVAAAVVRLATATSLEVWDGWAIWGLKAHALYADGTTSGPVFHAAPYVGSHPSYPVAQPLLAATWSSARGRLSESQLDVLPALLLVAFGVAAWGVLRTLVPGWLAAATGLAATSTWVVVVNTTDDYADGPLAAVVALGVLLLAVRVVTGSALPLLLGAAVLGAGGLVKLEGLVFALAALAAVALVELGRGRGRRTIGIAAAIVVAPVALWLALTAAGGGAHDPSYDLGLLLDGSFLRHAGGRIATIWRSLLHELATTWRAALVVGAAAVALALLARRPRLALFLPLWSALSLVGLTLPYLTTTADLDWQLRTSAARVVFSLGLGLAVTAPLVAVASWDSLVRRAAGSRAESGRPASPSGAGRGDRL